MSDWMSEVTAGDVPMSGDARTGPSDEEVIRRLVAGEVALFEVIMRRYNQRLFRIARSIVREDQEAQDAVQEAYLSAFSHLGQFAGQSQFSTWLTRIAINEALARRRRRARGRVLELDDDIHWVGTAAASPEDEASRREMSRLLEAVIDELPAIYRIVFVMREMEQMSTAETASALGIAEETIKIRLYRAKGLLRQAMSSRMQPSLAAVYPFLGERCDRIVRAVMSALAAQSRPMGAATKRRDGA